MSLITQFEKQLHDYSETLAFICWEVANVNEWRESMERKYIESAGSIALLNIFIEWANEFQDMYTGESWENNDWIETITNFIESKI